MHPPPPVVASVVPLPLLVADTAPVLLSVVLVLVLVGGVVVPEPSVGLTAVVPVELLPDSEALSVATGSLS